METQAEPLIPKAAPSSANTPPPKAITKVPWIPLAAASGACAAINGVFAKLTTTKLTTSWASTISTSLSLSDNNKFIEFLIRALFFSLNLAFNALMWALFTAALTRASSTTRVSIINTSANFLLTAFSGWMVFGEKLPGGWWVGACGLVVGNVVIGRREEEGDNPGSGSKVSLSEREEGQEARRERYQDSEGVEELTGGISDGVELGVKEGAQR